ncbi:uncharacterized protein LOC124961290 [Sciurus carolinensis]|uniref:uncharacterized protein LOC124961290 n=1 Tax=Sciurus carolinensis TaxID=30640 RepID=UPI001FB3A7E1|nr:uncharacterized protein LOC124961290 [Sciurus carolinensis]
MRPNGTPSSQTLVTCGLRAPPPAESSSRSPPMVRCAAGGRPSGARHAGAPRSSGRRGSQGDRPRSAARRPDLSRLVRSRQPVLSGRPRRPLTHSKETARLPWKPKPPRWEIPSSHRPPFALGALRRSRRRDKGGAEPGAGVRIPLALGEIEEFKIKVIADWLTCEGYSLLPSQSPAASAGGKNTVLLWQLGGTRLQDPESCLLSH